MELMIVIVIIGILSAVGMVMFGGQAEKAKIAVVKSNLKMVTKFISFELMNCIINGKIKTWSYTTGNPPNTAVDTDCIQERGRDDDFSKFWRRPWSIFYADPKSWPNPFNPNDERGSFVGDSDPPLPEYVGRITCGKKDSWDYVNCYGRWGTGANDYDTIKIYNPF